MRRKKRDYKASEIKPVPIKALLSMGTGKHKEKNLLFSEFDPAVLDTFSRSHSGKYSQYKFEIVGISVFVIISQYGTDFNKQVREINVGSVDRGNFCLRSAIALSPRKLDASIFSLADMLGVDCQLLIQQLQRFASVTTVKPDPDQKPIKQVRDLSGPHWKLRLLK